MSKENQLPHLINSLPEDVTTYQTSFYTVALEGWRRGLKLKYYNSKRGGRVPSTSITYSLSDDENQHRFVCARGTKSSKGAISKAENKSTAYEYMKRNGVPVPESKTFELSETSIDEICEHGHSMGYPLVIKPTDKGGGRGVVTHIDSKEMLKESILKVTEEFDIETLLVEKYFEGGVDYRFFVIEDEVIAVTKSYSSNVIGDGENNIKELIRLRNIQIKNNVAAKNRAIVIDDEMINFLKERNISLEDVPEKGERVFLREHGTHLGKRLSVDCTDTINPKFKKYAVDALNSIPGLPTGSIDMIINEETDEGIVNEINTKGEIMMHVFPMEGKAIDVPKKVIDYYFPNSKKINDNFFFEYKPVKDAFMSGHADEITIPMYPSDQQYKVEMTVEGRGMRSTYLKRLKKEAAKNYLKGVIKPESSEKLKLSLIGRKDKISSFEKYVNSSGSRKTEIFTVESSTVSKFTGTSSIGLELIEDEKTKTADKNGASKKTRDKDRKIRALEDEVKRTKEKYEQERKLLIKEKEKITADHNKMLKSTSWRLTSPLRKIRKKIGK